MQRQARRDAVTVEIVYAVFPSVLFVVVAVTAGAVGAWAFSLRGTAWGVVGAIGLVALVVSAVARTLTVLVRARRRGL